MTRAPEAVASNFLTLLSETCSHSQIFQVSQGLLKWEPIENHIKVRGDDIYGLWVGCPAFYWQALAWVSSMLWKESLLLTPKLGSAFEPRLRPICSVEQAFGLAVKMLL